MKRACLVCFLVILFIILCGRFNPTAADASATKTVSQVYGIEMLWNNSMQVNDVAVSKDGKYLAAVNGTGLYYFSSSNSTPKWWFPSSGQVLSVALSANGEYVVVGNNSGYINYFNNSRARTNQQPSPTWTSIHMGGPIERRTLDISDNGEYVTLGGTGVNMWYYAGCSARSGIEQNPTWAEYLSSEIRAVDISPDGKYVAAGGTGPSGGFVAFYKDANNETSPPTNPTWHATSMINSTIVDLAVSDDGYSVVGVSTFSTLYYWANATTLTNDPNATWTHDDGFGCVDMSSNGNSVVAGDYSSQNLTFWTNAKVRQGPQTPDWTRLNSTNVLDVALSDDGELIATAIRTSSFDYKAYFYLSNGTMLGEFSLLQNSPIVSMSGNGATTAIAGPGFDSLYVFGLTLDKTPPTIDNVHQQPANGSVHPEDTVMILANVTDDLSGVQQVVLSFSNGNGTWFAYPMQNSQENQYNATIPQYPYCTYITYVIIAADNANNTITTQEMGYTYQYHVIPEFPPALAAPLFAIATLSAITFHKRRKSLP